MTNRPDTQEPQQHGIPDYVQQELALYAEQIRKYRAGEVGETKMQKLRLHFGTYAQRQEGVQMQRIKIPGGVLNSKQLIRIAEVAERYASGFIHLTTREDAQIYYVKLEEVPSLLSSLAEVGVTTREACGNTVRNVTACYRSGTARSEPFNVAPYADALFRYLVRNKYNQNMGRKFKVTFEGCSEDHSGLRIHDIGLHAVMRPHQGSPQRGFRVYLGGGLGSTPFLANLYEEFLPVEELFNLVASALRLFDRYGERKVRMKARLKFLIQKLGWDPFCAALEEERQRVGEEAALVDYLREVEPPAPVPPASSARQARSDSSGDQVHYRQWVHDSVVEHKIPELRGVHVRLKLGDITTEAARGLAHTVDRFSAGELRISIEQNFYLPWVRAEDLGDLYLSLKSLGLADAGAETIADVTTCPGADTCRLGIASAKGLGAAISGAIESHPSTFPEIARSLRVKISGCPNGCAQHSLADFGFHAAALSHEGRTIPAYLLFLGGKSDPNGARFGQRIGRFPARNGARIMETLMTLFRAEAYPLEEFSAFVERMGTGRLKQLLEPFRTLSSAEDDPSLYEDWGHENEKFTVRQGIKGECAGSTVAEVVPTLDAAKEALAQAEAYFYHKEFSHAMLAAYEAAALAARVPLYGRLVDPFTSLEALWEFENLFVLSGQTEGAWQDLTLNFETWKQNDAGEAGARRILSRAKEFLSYCSSFSIDQVSAPALSVKGTRATL